MNSNEKFWLVRERLERGFLRMTRRNQPVSGWREKRLGAWLLPTRGLHYLTTWKPGAMTARSGYNSGQSVVMIRRWLNHSGTRDNAANEIGELNQQIYKLLSLKGDREGYCLLAPELTGVLQLYGKQNEVSPLAAKLKQPVRGYSTGTC